MNVDNLTCGNCGYVVNDETDVFSTPNWRLGEAEARCPECGNRWVVE